jgi:putative transcriptional regulator
MSASARISLANQFLIAMPGMADDTFAGTVIYLCEHNEKGALGLVINKPIDIKLKNLFEKVELPLSRAELAEQPVYFGGPVQTERGFVLHEGLAATNPAPTAPRSACPAGWR